MKKMFEMGFKGITNVELVVQRFLLSLQTKNKQCPGFRER